jgi:hypothetical protein
MYSILSDGDDVYLQVSASPVAGQYGVPQAFKMAARQIFSQPS